MGFFSGVGNTISSVGGILNGITGVTSAGAQSQKYAMASAKQQYEYSKKLAALEQKYALQSAAVNNKYQKEFAKNAHQWEMQDLANAGLNPVLAAGGGASASGGGVSAASVGGSSVGSGSESGSGINPIELGLNAWSTITNTKNTAAQTSKTEAEIENVNADTILKTYQQITELEKAAKTEAERKQLETTRKALLEKLPHEIAQINAETKYTNERARGYTTSYSGGAFGVNGSYRSTK